MTFLRFVMFTFWNYYVLKLLRLETITFSDAMLTLCYAMFCRSTYIPYICELQYGAHSIDQTLRIRISSCPVQHIEQNKCTKLTICTIHQYTIDTVQLCA